MDSSINQNETETQSIAGEERLFWATLFLIIELKCSSVNGWTDGWVRLKRWNVFDPKRRNLIHKSRPILRLCNNLNWSGKKTKLREQFTNETFYALFTTNSTATTFIHFSIVYLTIRVPILSSLHNNFWDPINLGRLTNPVLAEWVYKDHTHNCDTNDVDDSLMTSSSPPPWWWSW